ncbi:MAG: hypothetical protein PHE12_02630, partial [Clostridia bacterium]|nr:hypothetical protein [Clostridia bacterium]
MVTQYKRILKIKIISVLIAVIMIMTTFSALSEMSTVKAAPLSPEFDLSRIYLKNPFSHNVSLEIGT